MTANAHPNHHATDAGTFNLEAVIERFEDAWQRGLYPPIDAFLPTDRAQRLSVLIELIHTDLEYRCRAGEPARVEEYLQRYPELASDDDVVLGLLATECETRHGCAGRVTLEEYLQRFPAYRERLLAEFRGRLPCEQPASSQNTETTVGQHEPLATPSEPKDGVSATPSMRAGLSKERSRYRPLRLHASGGLGEVFIARDAELPRDVALKRIQARHRQDVESLQRFLTEAEIIACLEHPGIVPIHGLIQDGDEQPCYAMRFIQGESLHQAIRALHGQPVSFTPQHAGLRQLLTRFIAVCNTIGYAHSRGVIHRDLKPANIMLGPYGETLVVDWGLAKRLDQKEAEEVPDTESATATVRLIAHQTQRGTEIGRAHV